jgi:hypothetical protein
MVKSGRFVILFALIAAGALGVARYDQPAATQPATQPAARSENPVRYRHIERATPGPLHMHVITVDLTDPRVRVRVCPGGEDPDGAGPWQTRLRTVRETAEQHHLACAVNGNFFGAKEAQQFFGRSIPYFKDNPARVWGWAMTDGKLWSDEPGSRYAMVVHRDRHITIAHFADKLPDDADQIVTGSELLVTDGKVSTKGTDRAPRTAVGIDRAGKTLFLVVVDGRDVEYSTGLASHELAAELITLGCYRALMLDGGGSSTMVMMDDIENVPKVMNRPSDGHDLPVKLSLERPVADVVGVELKDERERG